MLTGLKSSLKTSSMKPMPKNPPPNPSPFPIIRPKSPPPPPPEAHFITPSSPPTDLVSPMQLKEGGKKEESLARSERAGMADIAASKTLVLNAPVSREEKDAYAAARRFFDAKEFERVAFTLNEHKSAQSRFLCYYSQYLVCHESLNQINSHPRLGSRKARIERVLQTRQYVCFK